MRISDWSSDVCSSDLLADGLVEIATPAGDFEVVRNPAKDLARDDATTFVVSGDRIQLTKDQPAAGLNRMEAVVVGEEFVGATAVVYLEGPGGIEIKAQKSRSEEHTSELQSLMRISYAVFCLKKKKTKQKQQKTT